MPSSTSLTSTGIGSGIDIDKLVQTLVTAEGKAKADEYTRQEQDVTLHLTGYANLKLAIDKLGTASSVLKDPSIYNSKTATTDSGNIFTVDVTSKAVAGKFDVEVVNLAAANKKRSAYLLGTDTSVGTGKLTFSVGSNSFNIDIDSSNQTLSQIRDAINQSPNNTSLDATILTTSAGSSLILSARQSGASNSINITADNTADSTLKDFANQISDVKQMGSVVKADATSALNSTGDITIAVGGVSLGTITANSGDNLNTIRDAINGNSSIAAKVRASVVVNKQGAQLMLTQVDPTLKETIAISGTDTIKTALTDGFTANSYEMTVGADAIIKLDGQEITSASNTFSNVVTGVNITAVAKSDANKTSKLSITDSTESVDKAVRNFVSAYNQFQKDLHGLIDYNVSLKKGGDLNGDPIARSVLTTTRKIISSVNANNGLIKNLSGLGISVNRDGTLEIDSATYSHAPKLGDTLKNNLPGIATFFSDEKNGLGVKLTNALKEFAQSNGIIDQKKDTLTKQMENIDTHRTELSERLKKLEDNLKDKFNAMDRVVSSLRQQSTFITQQFSAINSANKG